MDVGNLISGSSAFSKSSLNKWKFSYCCSYNCWSLAWRIWSITLLAREMSAIVQCCEHSLVLSFFEIGMKTELSQSCGHWWVFQICWNIECSTFTASSFRISNSWAAILPPPLALLLVMLPKAHLTLHSRMSGSRWVSTSSWLSSYWRSILYSSSVYSCHLFLIPFASVRSILFLSFIVTNFAWNVSLVSLIFLKRSLVFPILLFYSTPLHCLLKKAFLSLLAIPWNSAFRWVYFSFSPCLLLLLYSQPFVRPPQTTILHFFFLGMVLITASCIMLRTSGHSSSGTLSMRSNSLNLSLPLYNHKVLIRECFPMQYWVPIEITNWVFLMCLDMYQVLLYSLYHFKSYKKNLVG